MSEKQPLLVIDGDSFAHRAYHALPKSIVRPDGSGGNAIVGFANFLIKLYVEEQPRAVLVGWDTLDVPNHRQALFPAYQSGRVFDEELLQQLNDLPQFVDACGFANAKTRGYEADDFLAAAGAREEELGRRTLVASGDRDTFQLASDLTTILYPVRAGVMERVGPNEVREKYGVGPKQVPDFIALRGDPSDRIPGAKGVGPSTAASIVRKYGSLENALADGRFEQQATELRLYRKIATMDPSAPIPRLRRQFAEWGRASALARVWGLKQLADRLSKLQT
jgi:DNA polymerase-1